MSGQVIIDLFDEIDRLEKELADYTQVTKVHLKDLKMQVRHEIANALGECSSYNARKFANQVYWGGIEHPGTAKAIKAAWQEIFGHSFDPDPVSTDFPCRECGEIILATSLAQFQHYNTPEVIHGRHNPEFWPGAICPKCEKTQSIRWAEERRAEIDRIEKLKAMPYSEYLQTEHWEAIRKAALKRARYRCQLCSSDGKLNVHHRTYERRGEERASDLIVLCEACHGKFHDKVGQE